MMSSRRLPAPPLVWSLMAPFTVLALGTALQTVAPDSSAPSAIEQALIERRCDTTRAAGAPRTDVYQECLSIQLLSLRTDFGRDLRRLSGAERKTLDSVCSQISAARGRDAYVECVSDQLSALRSRRSRTNPNPQAAAPLPPPSVSDSSADLAPLAAPASASSSVLWIGVALVTLSVAAAGVLLATKARRATRKCRVCGVAVQDSGDLCQKCRHEAAEAIKRAATERPDHQRAQDEEQRRKREHEEKQRRLKAFQEEEERLQQQELARQAEQARREEESRQRDEQARRQPHPGVASEEVFDPYAVLGVSRDASQADIRAAYEEANLKYDPEQVAHLGVELQEHFKTKAQAVERAYRELTA